MSLRPTELATTKEFYLIRWLGVELGGNSPATAPSPSIGPPHQMRRTDIGSRVRCHRKSEERLEVVASCVIIQAGFAVDSWQGRRS
jgi:hypothetical protein